MTAPLVREDAPDACTAPVQRLRLLSYNIQVGINSVRPHHYVTRSWRHVLPHPKRFQNLDRIAELLTASDIVALQEVDAGSHRTSNVNLTEYLANQAQFAHWYHQVNRDFAGFARHANGLLSRYKPTEITEYKLPGFIPGRGALVARYGKGKEALAVVLIHLALGQRTRLKQLEFIAELIQESPHAVLMGDMNCEPGSLEMRLLFARTHLREPVEELCTFPSWRPVRNIDHILVTSRLQVTECRVINNALSDHLPIAMEVAVPPGVRLG
jgi:endonuclease/exonuclease/phosphatase family metal-dependent hydrolase